MTQDELKQLQQIQTGILEEFDRVCRKHDIKYVLASGTLIGAVRYKAFIPWDDDVDVEMLRSDYEKFKNISKQELSGNFFFQDHTTDKGYPWLYGKLRQNGTLAVRLGQEHFKMHHGVCIDIFPRDGVPNGKTAHSLHKKITKIIRKILYARQARVSAETKTARFGWSLVCIIPKTIAYVTAGLLRKLNPTDKRNKVRCIGYHGTFEDAGYNKEWFTDLTEMEFEGKQYLVPADWNGYLTHIYGEDYMTPPPEDKRAISAPLSSYELV